jgi:hypothetical protein
VALGLGIDLADVGRKRALLLFQTLDAFDQRFELSRHKAVLRHTPPHLVLARIDGTSMAAGNMAARA